MVSARARRSAGQQLRLPSSFRLAVWPLDRGQALQAVRWRARARGQVRHLKSDACAVLQRSLLTDPLPALLLIHLGALTDTDGGRIVIHPRTLEGQWRGPARPGGPAQRASQLAFPRVAAVAGRGSDARPVASERAGASRRPPRARARGGRRRPRDEQPSRRSVDAGPGAGRRGSFPCAPTTQAPFAEAIGRVRTHRCTQFPGIGKRGSMDAAARLL